MAQAQRYHVQAWGSELYPNLDQYCDEPPLNLCMLYPCVSISAQRAVSVDDFLRMEVDPKRYQ